MSWVPRPEKHDEIDMPLIYALFLVLLDKGSLGSTMCWLVSCVLP